MAAGDDFWDQSEVKGYSFDENESNGGKIFGCNIDAIAQLSQEIKEGIKLDFSETVSQDHKNVRPELHTLISEDAVSAIFKADCLEYGFGRISTGQWSKKDENELSWDTPCTKVTLRKILLGEPFSLELYKSLKSKKELLEASVSSGDGNAILVVVLFLSQTLKKSLFNQLMSANPVAVDHYVNYLSTRQKIQELTDILEMLGRSKDAAVKQFAVACQNPQRQLPRLTACLRNHYNDSRESVIVDNYIKLIEWQLKLGLSDLTGKPVLECLAYACANHWGENKGEPSSPHTLVQLQGVSEKHFQWLALVERAKASAWSDIEALLITKGWLGAKKVKALFPMEKVVVHLHKLKAPMNILLGYIELIDDVDTRLSIAKQLRCHRAVIDIFISQRDRQALLNYKANLDPKSEDYLHADIMLHAPNTKWKN